MLKTVISQAWDTLRVFLLFVGCTLLFYYGILWVSQEYEGYHRYNEPKGRAVKVVQMDNPELQSGFFERLLQFYYLGE